MAAHKSGQTAGCGAYCEKEHKGFTESNSGYDHDAVNPEDKRRDMAGFMGMSKQTSADKAKGY